MRTKVLYHQVKPGTDCPDGIASAWVVAKALPCQEIEGCVYQSEPPSVKRCDRIVIVDFSFPATILEEWALNAEVIVIDHHKTALNDLAGLSNRVLQKFDLAECGATLAWKHFFSDKAIPAFLKYVKDRDFWDFDLLYSEEIHEAVSNLKYQTGSFDKIERTFAIFNMLEPLSEQQLQMVLAPIGDKLLAPKRKRIHELFETAEIKTLQGHQILTVEVPEAESRLISDLCSYLYKKNPQYPFVVAWYEGTTGINLSFRSDKKGSNFDVSAIAKLLGGGGHHNAAGALVAGGLPWEKGK